MRSCHTEGEKKKNGDRKQKAHFVYKWTDEDVEKLINARIERGAAFSGRRNAAAHDWDQEVGELLKELKQPPTGQGTESGEATAGSWKWYPLMDEALGGRPSIQPPVLVASAWGGHSQAAAVAEPAAGPERQEEFGPGPSKRQREDPALEFLKKEAEKAEERARREEQREERLLSLLEKIVDKM
ncbi:hypothetical protein AAFF_G00008590 [Aldrovandia affinis]|uniref:Uncharacterized protein n=1 Tax=Aldrovandia affinis TaxID=143900 RepID=A0AAD7T7T6_9TELE|nr:hypothetical protein AAFF_G00008590 [Aldrovandia affinis]